MKKAHTTENELLLRIKLLQAFNDFIRFRYRKVQRKRELRLFFRKPSLLLSRPKGRGQKKELYRKYYAEKQQNLRRLIELFALHQPAGDDELCMQIEVLREAGNFAEAGGLLSRLTKEAAGFRKKTGRLIAKKRKNVFVL